MKQTTEKDSQEIMVLKTLLLGYKMTGLDALKLFGIISFPKRISTLRQMGHKIEQQSITVKGRFGQKRVNQYWIKPSKVSA